MTHENAIIDAIPDDNNESNITDTTNTPVIAATKPAREPSPNPIEDLVDTREDTVTTPKTHKWWRRFGKSSSIIFAISCGINTAAALSSLLAGPVFWAVAAVLCVLTTYANYRMTHHDVSNTFADGILKLFKKKKSAIKAGESEYLSWKKIFFIAGGIVLSVIFGAVFGALTFNSTIMLVVAFPILASISVALPPIGIVLGVFTFLTMATLMTKAFSQLAQTENLPEKIKKIAVSLFFWDEERDKDKSIARVVCERIAACTLMAAMSVITLGLIGLGQYYTLKNCAVGFSAILNGFNLISPNVVNIISITLAQGCALAAQIPFILKTGLGPIVKLFSPKPKDDPSIPYVEITPPKSFGYFKIKTTLLVVASGFSAVASGAIALAGNALNVVPILASIGAFLNTFLGSVVNALVSQHDTSQTGQAIKYVAKTISTSGIMGALGITPRARVPEQHTNTSPSPASITKQDISTTVRNTADTTPDYSVSRASMR